MSDKNPFGGGNAQSLYTPMTEDEQEVLERLIEGDDLEVNIVGWGVVTKPQITFGDLRLSIKLPLSFDRPALPQPNWYFDLELRTRSGLVLYSERQATTYGGKPIQIAAGMQFLMVWDIAIQKIDPKIVKAIKPGALGLTTREGNRRLKTGDKELLHNLRQGEKMARQATIDRLAKAAKKAKVK